MNALEAAIQILAQTGEELSKQEIAKRAIESGIWNSAGKTPYETIGSQIYTDIKKHGEDSRFILVRPGVFKLKPHADVQLTLMPAQSQPPQTEEVKPQTATATPAKQESTTKAKAPAPRKHEAPQEAPRPHQHKVSAAATKPHHATATASELPELTYVAQRILQDHANGKPMHYKNIAAKAINAGWALPLNSSPAETIYAQVITEIKKRTRTGEPQRFVRYKNGFLGLAAWNDHDVAGLIQRQNMKVVEEMADRLKRLPADMFQTLLIRVLAETGFENVEIFPPKTHAQAFRATASFSNAGLFSLPVAFLALPLETPLEADTIKDFRNSLEENERGIIIATADVTREAADAARREDPEITILDTMKLAHIMVEFSIGMRKNPVVCYEIDNDELPDR